MAHVARSRRDAGSSLIETVVAAAVLAIAAGAVATLLLGASKTSIANRDRITAAGLAEQDQERLRATPFARLAALATATPSSSTVSVGEVRYAVQSTVRWVNDVAGFQPTCTTGTDGTSDYLQITSDVTPQANTPGINPQRVTSLLAPKVSTTGAKGTLSIPFADRNGDPLDGVPVTLAGSAANGSQTSNAAGCAVFTYFPAGNYVASYARSGYVTPGGSGATQSLSAIVTTGKTSFTAEQRLDKAATVKASVVTRTTSAATQSAGTVPAVSAGNAGIGNSSGTLTATSGTRASAFTIGSLFPFSSGYAVYAGSCAANDPTKYGLAAQTASPDPGATVTTTVFAPTLTVAIQGYTFRHLVVTATDAGCDLRYDLSFNPTSSVAVQLPYGTYAVCGDDGSYRATRTGVRLAGQAPVTLSYSVNEAVGGTCT